MDEDNKVNPEYLANYEASTPQKPEEKSTKEKIFDAVKGCGAVLLLDALAALLGAIGQSLNPTVPGWFNTILSLLILGIPFALFLAITYYSIKKKKKYMTMMLITGYIIIPLLFVGGCFLLLLGYGTLNQL